MPVPGVPGAVACPVAALPPHLPGGRAYSPIGEIAGQEMLLTSAGVCRCHVRAARIDFAPQPGADPILVERFLWGAARSALIHLRGELPLHASVIAAPGHGLAVALCGASGAGKSSLAAAMAQLGWTMMADDQARVTLAGAMAQVWAGPPLARLPPDTCSALNIRTDGLAVDADDRAKRLLPLSATPSAVRLAALIELGEGESSGAVSALSRGAALAVLSRHVVGQRKWRALRSANERFAALDAIAARAPVSQLHRPPEEPLTLTARRLVAYLDEAVLARCGGTSDR